MPGIAVRGTAGEQGPESHCAQRGLKQPFYFRRPVGSLPEIAGVMFTGASLSSSPG